MRTVIVEDEEPILKLMEIVISRNKHLEIIGQFTDSRKALRNIPKLSPDVVFVDVKMPFINGIELSRKIKNFDENIQIVFVTAYEKYAIEAFKVNAVNYILKPITEEDLNVTVNRLLKNMHIRKVISRDNKKNQIFTLGCFRVYGGLENEIIRWSTSKVQELFAYFVCNRGNEADKWNLCDMLWPNFPSKNAEHNLYSTIYRLKIDFKNRGTENIVNYENGKYGINLKNFYCDSWEFEDFIESNPFVNEKNIVSYEKNTALYKGTLFGDNNYSWDADLNEKLRRYYLFSVKNIAKYYMKKKFYNKSEEYLKKAIAVNFFDEEAQELIMKVYFHMGDRIDLVKHYKKLSSALKRQLHVTPKKSTIELYKSLLMKL